MTLKIFEIINILLAAIVGGMYWGPWLALSISIKKFNPAVFLAVVDRLNKNMEPLMTVLTPLSLFATLPVLVFLYLDNLTISFYCTLTGFLFYVLALVVTIVIEVPIVKQMVNWTEDTLPENWEFLRDKWGRFHIIRVTSGILGLVFFLIGAIF